MEIRTTNPELEEMIRILADNDLNGVLRNFAYKCSHILPFNLDDDIPLISIEQDAQQRSDIIEFEKELPPYPSTEHIVRVVGVQKCQDPAAAAYLSRKSTYHPNDKLAALQTAYWVRQFVILYGIRKGNTLEEISEMVRKASALQVKYLRAELRRNRATKYLPKELRKSKDTRPPDR